MTRLEKVIKETSDLRDFYTKVRMVRKGKREGSGRGRLGGSARPPEPKQTTPR